MTSVEASSGSRAADAAATAAACSSTLSRLKLTKGDVESTYLPTPNVFLTHSQVSSRSL